MSSASTSSTTIQSLSAFGSRPSCRSREPLCEPPPEPLRERFSELVCSSHGCVVILGRGHPALMVRDVEPELVEVVVDEPRDELTDGVIGDQSS